MTTGYLITVGKNIYIFWFNYLSKKDSLKLNKEKISLRAC